MAFHINEFGSLILAYQFNINIIQKLHSSINHLQLRERVSRSLIKSRFHIEF